MPASKGANLHCIGAMTASSIVLFTTRIGASKAPDCVQWFEQLIETCTSQGIIHPTFIIDNAPVHSRVEELLEEYPDIRILRLAPYSYLLNPIELVWSVFKSNVKRMLRDKMPHLLTIAQANGLSMTEQRMQELENIARGAISKITP